MALPFLRSLCRVLLLAAALALFVGPAGAQTPTPTDHNEGLRLTPASDGVTLFWWGRVGRTYFVQHSTDLRGWRYAPVIFSGDGGPLQWHLLSTAATTGKFFVRLLVSAQSTPDPATDDFDGDGRNNLLELSLGTDPFIADTVDPTDTNANDLPDQWEISHGLSLTYGTQKADGNADSDGDGITDYEEFQLGLNPSTPYSTGGGSGGGGGSGPNDGDLDSDGDGKKNAEDAYPSDERRTEDIAPLRHAFLDLAKPNPNAPDLIPADKDLDQIAMSEDGRVAFSWWEGEKSMVAKWANGKLEADSPKETGSRIRYLESQIPDDEYDVAPTKDNFYRENYYKALNPDGSLYQGGYFYRNSSVKPGWVAGVWRYGEAQANDFYIPSPIRSSRPGKMFFTTGVRLRSG